MNPQEQKEFDNLKGNYAILADLVCNLEEMYADMGNEEVISIRKIDEQGRVLVFNGEREYIIHISNISPIRNLMQIKTLRKYKEKQKNENNEHFQSGEGEKA